MAGGATAFAAPVRKTRRGPPRIGIDAHGLAARRTGVEVYVAGLVEGLGRVAPDEDIGLYVQREPSTPLPFRTIRVPPSPCWTTVRLSAHFAARSGPRAMLQPAHSIQLFSRPATVVTIHDLAFERFPDHFSRADRVRMRAITRHAAARAEAIITGSYAARADIVELLGVPEARVRVVHHGYDPRFVPPAPDVVAAVRRHYGLARPYLLTVGTCQSRKNHATLIRALPALRAAGLDLDLVIAGGSGWLYDDARRLAASEEASGRVRMLGYVPDEHLPGLYAGASASALVSLYEGFGFPVLEALACGAPTLVSNVSSLPEVGGDAVLLVDPRDVEGVAESIRRLVTDDTLRTSLLARAPAQLARFSWERSARSTLDLLNEVA